MRPIRVKNCKGGKLGDYVYLGLFIVRSDCGKCWWIKDYGNYGPSIKGDFKKLSDCATAIETWLKERDRKRSVKNRKHLKLLMESED